MRAPSMVACGLCALWYTLRRRDRTHYAGLREAALDRVPHTKMQGCAVHGDPWRQRRDGSMIFVAA